MALRCGGRLEKTRTCGVVNSTIIWINVKLKQLLKDRARIGHLKEPPHYSLSSESTGLNGTREAYHMGEDNRVAMKNGGMVEYGVFTEWVTQCTTNTH